jgi:DNA-binding MarR family transcriptional regulator
VSTAQDIAVRAPDAGPDTVVHVPDNGPEAVVPAPDIRPDTAVPAPDAGDGASDGGADEVARRLRVAITRLSRRIAHAHPDTGVTPKRLIALGVLELTGAVRIGALADRLGTSPPTASRLVDCLHERGLVARTPDPDDHRATRVGLTPTGLACLHDYRARTTDDLAGRIDDLPADRRALLAAALPVLEEIAWRNDPRP